MTGAIENYDRAGMSPAKSLKFDMTLEELRGRIVGDARGGFRCARGIAHQGIAQAGFEGGDLVGLRKADNGAGQSE